MNNQQTIIPTARCKAYAALLPILDEPDINPDAAAEARSHLATCAYCQQQSAAYRQLATAARRYLSPPASPLYSTEEIMGDVLGELVAAPAVAAPATTLPRRSPRQPGRSRRLVAGLVPLAAVLVIVLVSVTLFVNHARLVGQTGNGAPPPTASSLLDISIVSATEGWAVGYSGPCTTERFNASTVSLGDCQTTNSVLMHYHNGIWTNVPPSFQDTGSLNSISMLSASDGWAGGTGLFIHYNGHVWQALPSPHTLYLNRMQMFSDTDGWAVGIYGGAPAIMRYNGHDWNPQLLPVLSELMQQRSIRFSGLDMISPTEGWVVGTLYKPPSGSNFAETDLTAIILHYANGQWTLQSSTDSATMDSVAMVSAKEGWAVGSAGTFAPHSQQAALTGKISHAFLLHYAQGQWTEVTTPTISNEWGTATSVSMDAASDGWAIGPSVSATEHGPLVTHLLHYNGQQWTPVPALAFQQSQNKLVALNRLQMLSATDGWAVGLLQINNGQSFSNGQDVILSLTPVIVHYHNGAWSIVPTA